MVTQAQRTKLWTSFLTRHSNIVDLKNSKVIEVPFNHFVRGICLDGSPDKNVFYPTSFIWPLYSLPRSDVGLSIGYGRRFGSRSSRFNLNDENIYEILDREIEIAWARLTKVADLAGYFDYLHDGEWVPNNPGDAEWLTLAALGCFEVALAKMQRVLVWQKNAALWQHEPAQVQRRANTTELARRLEHDQGRVYELLHEWEAHNAKMSGVSAYWAAAPFPGELTTTRE
jgi:hypothetical protein